MVVKPTIIDLTQNHPVRIEIPGSSALPNFRRSPTGRQAGRQERRERLDPLFYPGMLEKKIM